MPVIPLLARAVEAATKTTTAPSGPITGDAARIKIAYGSVAGFKPRPSTWIPPNLINPNYVPEKKNESIFNVSIVISIITIFIVVGRLWARWRVCLQRSYG